MAAEALLLLAAAWPVVRLFPFRWYAPVLGQQQRPPRGRDADPPLPAAGLAEPGAAQAVSEQTARDVARALARAARYLPVHATCLMLAAAGKVMLRRRGCPGTVYFGVAPGDDGSRSFHAWLRSGAVWVSGGREAPGHTVLSVFR